MIFRKNNPLFPIFTHFFGYFQVLFRVFIKINISMSGILFEYFFEYKHGDVVKMLRIVAEHSSIAREKLKETYPDGELKLLELRPLDH